jgi:DNA processing protein
MAEHGTAAAALAALPTVARAAGIDDYEPCPLPVALAELKAGRKIGARLILHRDPDYPADLRDIDDAPPLLWARGNTGLLARPMVALVGARNASSLGLRMARKLSQDLGATGHVTVSGLARGIVAAAHEATLASGTIAVMAGGVDVIYPTENTQLYGRIAEQGLILSEQPPGLVPQARHFPTRNRIVSGLARALVVVEAAAKSGSLITARAALDQGREVLAVPGHPMDARAAGCNMLIRDGARLVRDAADVLDALPPTLLPGLAEPAATRLNPVPGNAPPQIATPRNAATGMPVQPALVPDPPPARPWRQIAALHAMILDRLAPAPLAEDQLIRDLAADAQSVAPALLDLELDGQIQRHPGGLITRTV